ncbi:hypothetical protein [Rhizobium gallicum]|uniref:hypothetical protein n=1 Tax=Rhizobium gallicum TaxID=56730 RepID=UPI001EF76AA3|nr:hypothetical protein [Rhizobium gallicum]ULJ72588.1 hypothetical protein L2W42_02480 [Rhizobium gallicum]
MPFQHGLAFRPCLRRLCFIHRTEIDFATLFSFRTHEEAAGQRSRNSGFAVLAAHRERGSADTSLSLVIFRKDRLEELLNLPRAQLHLRARQLALGDWHILHERDITL